MLSKLYNSKVYSNIHAILIKKYFKFHKYIIYNALQRFNMFSSATLKTFFLTVKRFFGFCLKGGPEVKQEEL